MEEIWVPVIGYEGDYEVSNKGNIKSLKVRPRLLKKYMSNSGYLRCVLCKNGKSKPYSIHRLVAQAFIPNPDNLPQINHKDENKQNNCVDNLEWCTASYNYWYGSNYSKISESLKRAWVKGKLEGREAWNKGAKLKNTGKLDNFIRAGKLNAEKLKKPIDMIDKQTGIVLMSFDSITNASKYLGKNYTSSIISCANGSLKSAFGYVWKYK